MAIDQNKIRILHLITRYHLRGAERFASQLSGYLTSRGYRNSVCSIYQSDTTGFAINEAVDCLSVGARLEGPAARIGLQPTALIKLVDIFRKVKPDIVFAHGSDTIKYAALAGRFYPRVPIVYKNIGMASYWAQSRFKVWANRRIFHWTDAIVSVSQASREDFLKLYRVPPSKVSVITNAIDSSRFRALEIGLARSVTRQKLGLAEGDNVLISVGSLSPEKNQEEMVTLVNELNGISPHLLLVGDGPSRRKLERFADQLHLHDRVHFLGLQDNILPFLAASDVFVLTSRSEGMPGVLIEAGMAGLPSVSYDVGGVKEVIDQDVTGIIVPPQDHKRFKDAIISLLSEPLNRKRMGSQARQECLARFDIEKVAGEYEALILNLLKARKYRDNTQ